MGRRLDCPDRKRYAARGAFSGGRPHPERLELRCLLSVTGDFSILSVSPANGSVVPALPNGEVVVTLSQPVAGLADGQSPIQTTGTFNPYDVILLARGPDGVFSAPTGVDGGDLPLHVNVVYHVNGNGTSEFVITPTGPLSTDVFAVHVDLAAFRDASGQPLTDANNGYRTFLLQKPAVNPSAPLQVTGVTALNGQTVINNDVVPMPDTIQIHFNKPLFAGAAGNGNVQLIANPGPNFSIVPSVAAYSPTTDSIYLTPTERLGQGTVYAVRVAGQDSGSTYVSDDQGFGGPGYPLPHTFYDTFSIAESAPPNPIRPFRVSATLPPASTTSTWTQPVGYALIRFTEPLDPQSLGRYSAMLIPRSGGLNTNAFDAGDVPLNATVAYNPAAFQLIIVPSQPVGDDVYLYALSNMRATNGDPLLNNFGQPAGVSGNPAYYATFGLTAGSASASVAPTGRSHPAAVLGWIPDLHAAPSFAARRAVPAGPLGTAWFIRR